MIEVTEYEIATGKITAVLQASAIEYINANQKTGHAYVSGSISGDDFYFLNGEKTARPTMALVCNPTSIQANGADVVTVAGLPTGLSEVRVMGAVVDTWTEDNSSFELTTNVVGQFVVEVDHWPYKVERVTFNAT